MYKPGGFPEFLPEPQKVWDMMLEIVQNVFKQHNYQHIRTPAVEPVEVLKKWWDIIEQQVYGLFWLAQWPQDVKDYALHFDLTVPLARYVLDHQQELVFPFSRYQAQPVWRGEAHKRGRHKELWQCDIDTIWRSETNVWTWYDVQSILVMEKAIKAVCDCFKLTINYTAKVSHLNSTKSLLTRLWLDQDQSKQILKILDNYFKVPEEKSLELMVSAAWADNANKIVSIINSKDYTQLAWCDGYEDLETIVTSLNALGATFEYDICIVRGQNYYSGMVVEWMDMDEISYGSLAAWGRYDNLTTFLDPKQSFSGVGTSLGRFTSLVMERITSLSGQDVYLFVHFADSKDDILRLYNSFLESGKVCEFYPVSAKIGKQFEYAEKKDIRYAILYGETEKAWGYYVQKDLISWEQVQVQLGIRN